MLPCLEQVCRQLDALSHFQFAPKPVGSNADAASMGVQSIALEDVAPVSMAVGSAQAPEQMVGKKRGLAAQFISEGEEEVTRSDRQKMRRKQQKHKQKQGGQAAAGEGAGAQRRDEFQDLKNDSRVIQKHSEKSAGKSEYSKSSEFFSRLQQEVSSGISKKKLKEKGGVDSTETLERSSRVKL